MISECFSRNCVSLSWKTALKLDAKWSALATLLYALKSLHRPVGHCGIIFLLFFTKYVCACMNNATGVTCGEGSASTFEAP